MKSSGELPISILLGLTRLIVDNQHPHIEY